MSYQTYDFMDCIQAQKEIAPTVYGNLDLDFSPERFYNPLAEGSLVDSDVKRQSPHNTEDEILALFDDELVEFYRQQCLMGDPFADELAAVMLDEMGIQQGKTLFQEASERGVDSVKDAPQAMVNFFRHQERTPEWLDYDVIEDRNDRQRLVIACLFQVILRGGFLGVYENDYASMPMVITGGLSEKGAAKRIKDTTSMVRATVFPGAMRHGEVGYRMACRVRLMHAMVRVNLLRKPEVWDIRKYGVPLPQADTPGPVQYQTYPSALKCLREGRDYSERELADNLYHRYLTHLMGVHDFYAPIDSPQKIVNKWEMRFATHRAKRDPERYRPMVKAALGCYLQPDESAWSHLVDRLDRSGAKHFYANTVGEQPAAEYGVRSNMLNRLAFYAHAGIKFAEYAFVELVGKIPGGRNFRERYADRKLKSYLSDGVFDSMNTDTNASTYRVQAQT